MNLPDHDAIELAELLSWLTEFFAAADDHTPSVQRVGHQPERRHRLHPRPQPLDQPTAFQ
jgi:hypothetical protein